MDSFLVADLTSYEKPDERNCPFPFPFDLPPTPYGRDGTELSYVHLRIYVYGPLNLLVSEPVVEMVNNLVMLILESILCGFSDFLVAASTCSIPVIYGS